MFRNSLSHEQNDAVRLAARLAAIEDGGNKVRFTFFQFWLCFQQNESIASFKIQNVVEISSCHVIFLLTKQGDGEDSGEQKTSVISAARANKIRAKIRIAGKILRMQVINHHF